MDVVNLEAVIIASWAGYLPQMNVIVTALARDDLNRDALHEMLFEIYRLGFATGVRSTIDGNN